jgi:hypothetical protein
MLKFPTEIAYMLRFAEEKETRRMRPDGADRHLESTLGQFDRPPQGASGCLTLKKRYLTERLGKNCHYGAFPEAQDSILWNQLSEKIVSRNNYFSRANGSVCGGPKNEDT